MNDKLKEQFSSLAGSLKAMQTNRKIIWGVVIVGVLVVAVLLTVWLSRPNMAPLYTNLSAQEAGEVTEKLTADGVKSEIKATSNGVSVYVPSEQVDQLKVNLAAAGIPKSGAIDYSFFSENAGFGTTDREMAVIERSAMQTELERLITQIEGINQAKVIISLPEKSVFLAEDQGEPTASIVLNLGAGTNLEPATVKGLYHLISKSVPNLKPENISVMDQYFTYYDLDQSTMAGGTSTDPLALKRQVEKDVRQQIQQMLSVLLGERSVLVSVTADIDTTQSAEEQNLVTPVNEDTMEGIVTSAERIAEAYTGGTGAAAAAGAGENDTVNFPAATGTGEEESEKNHEIINYEVNRITKQIQNAPYTIRDLGVQLIVEPPDGAQAIDPQLEGDLETMMYSIIRTSLAKTGEALTEAELEQKVVVVSRPFAETEETAVAEQPTAWWMYAAAAGAVVLLALLFFAMRRRNKQPVPETNEWEVPYEDEVPDLDLEERGEGAVKKKQLEKLAESNPEEFAKLLRTWMSEE
ncbi:flagellar basal body M-ring protein FliF [Exiguobacterium sp. SH0S7]|uniref:flagellar basal-body MS-ring/collar protein FliF n=2 Tax=unclassified Exiguobacterium TaxID=2644629 RepID=UPI00103E5CCB|nr:flagellar basal-body MS-ring/collar protein FliF [Exiguobacterium sp. SH0S7]TCI71897.1 flagellar basal body M-ring protein FliF [Exiguobacterium sp. SH0S7]